MYIYKLLFSKHEQGLQITIHKTNMDANTKTHQGINTTDTRYSTSNLFGAK
jgi:hypothetical protein